MVPAQPAAPGAHRHARRRRRPVGPMATVDRRGDCDTVTSACIAASGDSGDGAIFDTPLRRGNSPQHRILGSGVAALSYPPVLGRSAIASRYGRAIRPAATFAETQYSWVRIGLSGETAHIQAPCPAR